MASVAQPPARFDRVARIYRAMEYLSFGPLLERCRFSHLPLLACARRALVIGDGDGRFTVRMLAANRQIRAEAVDASSVMLRLLARRAERAGFQDRLTTRCEDARTFTPRAAGYDLVVTHFFLDCLTPGETVDLVARMHPRLAPGAQWIVSEFQVPEGNALRAWVSRGVIAALYRAFAILTGLAVREIPPWRQILANAGMVCCARRTWLGGLLVSELWQLRETTASELSHSHQSVDQWLQHAWQGSSVPGIDPGPIPSPGPEPEPDPAPAPDPEPYPGPMPAPQPVTRVAAQPRGVKA